ncbi:unnamed protein product, partial [Gulo gulo]
GASRRFPSKLVGSGLWWGAYSGESRIFKDCLLSYTARAGEKTLRDKSLNFRHGVNDKPRLNLAFS